MLLSSPHQQRQRIKAAGTGSSLAASPINSHKRSWSAATASASTTSTSPPYQPYPTIQPHNNNTTKTMTHCPDTNAQPGSVDGHLLCNAGAGTNTAAATAAAGPLSFPPPRFSLARKIKAQSSNSFTLTSQATHRSWRTINSLRDCQFGQVFLALEVTNTVTAGGWGTSAVPTGAYFAIKELSMAKIREMDGRTHENPLREVSALQYLSDEEHPNIVACSEALKDEESIYIVTRFCSGGEVFDILTEKGRFLEEEARPLFCQVLDGLLHLKRRGVCHRDVSMENLMMAEGNRVMLIDFGLALRIPQTADGGARVLPAQGPCGKQHYMSPEVLVSSGRFDGFAVDVWACGILLFVLLTGVPPFELALPSQDQRCRVIAVERRLGELLTVWKMPLSPAVVDLMQSCLLYDPERRPSLERLRAHAWVTG